MRATGSSVVGFYKCPSEGGTEGQRGLYGRGVIAEVPRDWGGVGGQGGTK